MIGTVSQANTKATKTADFKLTLLRRIYAGIHVDTEISEAIQFVAFADLPPQITFRDGATIVDHGERLSTSASSVNTRTVMIAMAIAKGWTTLRPSGTIEFVRMISREAALAGFSIEGVPPDVQIMADEILEQQQKRQRRIEQSGDAAQAMRPADPRLKEKTTGQRSDGVAPIITDNNDVSAEALAVMEAIAVGFCPMPLAESPDVEMGLDAKQHYPTDAQFSPTAGNAPVSSRRNNSAPGSLPRLQPAVNDPREIDDLKRIDIALVAASAGWSDVSRTHRDTADREGRKYRIYQRGGDTIKCSHHEDGRWLWVSNKSGDAGSVIDLWLNDNAGKTIGDARVALRSISGAAHAPPTRVETTPIPAQNAHTTARQRWLEAPLVEGQHTYAEDRGISKQTIERFGSEVRCGPFGGIYFAHRNSVTKAVEGFEQRWEKAGEKNTARFCKGGRKTVAVLGDAKTATRLLVFEGGLDCLAMAEIENRDDTLYISTGGGFGPATTDALINFAAGRQVFCAFDNDQADEMMTSKVREVIPNAQRLAPPFSVSGSAGSCKDWLEVLNAMKDVRGLSNDDEREVAEVSVTEVEEVPHFTPFG